MPSKVLISETASAPADSTALAISVMLVTLGESFTTNGFFVALRTCEVISAAVLAQVQKEAWACFTLGHEMFNSII